MKEYLLKLFNYNHWSTEVLLDAVEKNTIKDEYVLKMLSHYLNVLLIRFDNIYPTESKKYDLWEIHSVEKLKEMNDDITEQIINYLSKVKPRDIAAKMHSTSTDGDEILISQVDMFIHMANHGGHHRGQISNRMRILGFTPPGIGYLRYCVSFPDFW